MPGPIPTGTSRTFGLFVGGLDVTGQVPSDSVRITETGGDTTGVMEFTVESQSLGHGKVSHTSLGSMSMGVRLEDLTNARRLFQGDVVNVRRRHLAASGMELVFTATSLDAWLDRRVLPTWVSKRANGNPMDSDREMVTNVATLTGAGGYFDAINTYVASTKTGMPVVKVPNGGTAREILNAIAEAAATAADPAPRRFYIDFDRHLHYFKTNESLTAPYRLGDADYTRVVKATSGLVSLWAMRESTGTTVYDAMGNVNLTLAGGYTQNVTSLVPNEPGMRAVTLNGSTGYLTATDADLHNGDGPWTIELWFRRSTLSTTQKLWTSGTADVMVGFESSNKIAVNKLGTGANFLTDATFTDTSPHHLAVVRPNGGPTVVYVDGVSKAGTTTARTFVTSATAVSVGRKQTTTDEYFSGTLQDVAFYSSALSAATVLAHYNDGWTMVADDFEFETDANDTLSQVYVRGGNAVGSGWVYAPNPRGPFAHSLIDRPQSTTASLKEAVGQGYMRRDGVKIDGGRFTHTMAASTWRVGQTLTIDNEALGIDGSIAATAQTYEIKQINTYPNLGSGVVTYEIYFGALPWSGTFAVQRKKKR